MKNEFLLGILSEKKVERFCDHFWDHFWHRFGLANYSSFRVQNVTSWHFFPRGNAAKDEETWVGVGASFDGYRMFVGHLDNFL